MEQFAFDFGQPSQSQAVHSHNSNAAREYWAKAMADAHAVMRRNLDLERAHTPKRPNSQGKKS